MSKKKTPNSPPAASPAKKPPGEPRPDGIRETIESIVIAFLLAFLFRTFEAEAFVIPTGSMAPTLRGLHKDVLCENCGFPFQANASEEEDNDSNKWDARFEVRECTCSNCRHTMEVGKANPQGKSYPTYSGDRLWVTKFPYQFGEPQRWDVVVFKYPGKASQNYIKRLIGLPNETVRIEHGNIYTRPAGGDEARFANDGAFKIARKPPEKMRAMLQIVHDNDYTAADKLVQAGWPQRWSADTENAGWSLQPDGLSFTTDGADGTSLRYRHFVPLPDDWAAAKRGTPPNQLLPRRQLITDFTFYNTNHPSKSSGRYPDPQVYGQHWVGDLAVQCELTPGPGSGQVLLELVEGGRRFLCEIDTATGRARLSIDGVEGFAPEADTQVRGGGRHEVLFANVDDELQLMVDGRPAAFNTAARYDDLNLQNESPTVADLSPVGISAKGVSLLVQHLKVWRDTYYISTRHSMSDYGSEMFQSVNSEARFMSSPDEWASNFQRRQKNDFVIGPDQFVMLGDNSPRSKDSRLWSQYGDTDHPAHVVTRDLLIGKALFIYWPHSWNSIGRDGIWFPFFPNFSQMGFVR